MDSVVHARDGWGFPLLWSTSSTAENAKRSQESIVVGPKSAPQLNSAYATADGTQVIAQYEGESGGQLFRNGHVLAETSQSNVDVQLDPSHLHWAAVVKTNNRFQLLLDNDKTQFYTSLDGAFAPDGHWNGWGKRDNRTFLLRDAKETPVQAVTPIGKIRRYRYTRDGGVESQTFHSIFAVKRGAGPLWSVIVDGSPRIQLSSVNATAIPRISEDGTQWALLTKQTVVVNGRAVTPLYSGLAVPITFGNRSYAYAVRNGQTILPVINGVTQPPQTGTVQFSPPWLAAPNRTAYLVRQSGKGNLVHYVINGKVQRAYPEVGPIRWNPTTQGWAYVALRDNKSIAVVNGREYSPYTSISGIACAGTHWMLTGMSEDHPLVVLDGKEQKVPEQATDIQAPFVDESGHYAYVCETDEGLQFAVLDGTAEERQFGLFRLTPRFLPSPKQWVYAGGSSNKRVDRNDPVTLVAGGQEYKSNQWDVVLSPGSHSDERAKHWACVVRTPERRLQVVADGKALLAPADSVPQLWFGAPLNETIVKPLLFWSATRGEQNVTGSASLGGTRPPSSLEENNARIVASSGSPWISGEAPTSRGAIIVGSRRTLTIGSRRALPMGSRRALPMGSR